MYDYLVVGAGLFGAVFAHEAKKAGKKVLVIDKREHVAGNIYTKEVDGIQVHEYGAHIFHTSNKDKQMKIPQISKKYGITSSSLRNSIATQILRLQSTKMNCTTCRLI